MDKERVFLAVMIVLIFMQLFNSSVFARELQAEQVRRGPSSGQYISLTFDVEGGTDIERVLATLNTYQVKATFFLLGSWVEQYPELARRIVVDGHEIGNHSFSHPSLTRLSKEQIIRDINKAEAIIINATRTSPRPFFRPPYGAVNTGVLQAVREAGYGYSCLWSIDPRDWDGKPARAITSQVLDNLHPGAIVLLHINRTNTPEALPGILDGIIKKGYRVVPLSQLLGINQNIITTAAPRMGGLSELEGKYLTQPTVAKPAVVTVSNPIVANPTVASIEANLEVNGQLITMMNRPGIISNRLFVPIRDLARILDGEVSWNGTDRQAVLSVVNHTFKFSIDGDTLINNEKIPGVPSAVLINGRSMVPLIVISNQLDLPVSWEDRTRTANLILEV